MPQALWIAFLVVWSASLVWLGGVTHHGTPATAVAMGLLYLVSLPLLKEPARLSKPAIVALLALLATFLVHALPGPAFLFPYTTAVRSLHHLGGVWPASADSYYTARVLAQATTYTLAALFVMRLRQAGLPTSTILAGLGAVMAGEALVGLYQQFFSIPTIPFYGPRVSMDSASGTIVSRNNFAGLMAIAFVLAVARAWGRFAWPQRGGAEKPRWMRRLEGGWVWALAAFLFAVALVASKSRGGSLAAAGGLVLLPFLHRGRASLAGVVVLLTVAAVAVFVANPTGLAERFGQLDPFDVNSDGRWEIFTSTTNAALHQPVLGFGWGTHPRAYRPFQPPTIFGQVRHAHSEYINIFFEAGAVGLAVCLAAMGLWYSRVWRAQRTLPGPDRIPGTAALAAVSALLLHSFVDFDLRIPAIGMAWAALLGLGAAAVRDGDPRPTWPVGALAFVAAAAAWLVPAGGNLGFSPYDHEAAWRAGEVDVAADLWPADPGVQREAGLVAWERGDKDRAAICFHRLFQTRASDVDVVMEETGADGFEPLLPPTPAARAAYCAALAKRGLWKEAAAAFEKGPVDAPGCDRFAAALEGRGQWGLEAAVREKRLSMKSDAPAHAAAARAWLKLGWHDKALERATTASRIDPTNARWLGLRGAILADKGDGVAALEAFTQAITLAPNELEWRLMRAELAIAEKTFVSAQEDFEVVQKSRPDDRRVVLGLAQALIGQNLTSSAQILLDDWLRKHPEDGGAAALRETLKEKK